MNKRFIVPAAMVAVSSAISAIPVYASSDVDAVDGTTFTQGAVFYCWDNNALAVNDVQVSVYDVTSLTASADGTYDISALTPVKSYTTQNDDAYFLLNLNAGKYVAKITPPDGYVVKGNSLTKNAENEFIFDITNGGVSEVSLTLLDTSVESADTLSLEVIDTDFNPIAGAVFNVQREALDGTLYDLGDYTSDSNGIVSCPADDTDTLPVGSNYIFTIKTYPDGYSKYVDESYVLQAIEGLNTGSFVIKSDSVTFGVCTIRVVNQIFGTPVANLPIVVTASDGTQYDYTTDESGTAVVSGLPVGQYSVAYGGDSSYITSSNASFMVTETTNSFTTMYITDSTPKATVTIGVKDENGNAVTEATCELYDSNSNQILSWALDANGEILVNELEYGTYKVVLSGISERYISNNGTYSQEFTVSSETYSVPITLSLSPDYYGDCSIEVEITDADSYTQVLGQTVKILNEDNEVIQEVEMDEDGLAVFNNLPEGTYHFELPEDSDYYIVEGQTVTFDGNSKIAWQEIQAKKATTTLVLSTQCVDSAAVQDLSISLYKNGTLYGSYTMQNGTVSISDLKTGDYEIVVNSTLEKYKLFGDPTFSITVQDRVINKTLVFTEKAATVTVNVMDSAKNTGAAGVEVYITGNGVNTSGTTNDEGIVSFNVPLGSYNISAVTPTGYTSIASQSVTLEEDGQETTINLQTKSCYADLKVFVVDEDGLGLAGVTVEVVNSENQIMHTETTTSSDFCIDVSQLLLDTYTVRVTNYDSSAYVQPSNMELVLSEEKAYEAHLTLDRVAPVVTTGSVAITLKDVYGFPVSLSGDLMIAIYDSTDTMILCDYATPEGTIAFDELEAGSYKASIFIADEPYLATEESDVLFDIVAGETINVDMTLYKGVGSALFKVTDALTGNGVEGLDVEVFKAGTSIGVYTSNSDGEIAFPELNVGDYTYVIQSVPYGYELAANGSFKVVKDEATEVQIQLNRATGQAVLNVVDTNGNLISNSVNITLTDELGTEHQYWISGGSANTNWLPIGNYTVTVNSTVDGYTLLSVENVVISEDVTNTHQIIFQKDSGNATVKLQIYNVDGELGLANVDVGLYKDGLLIGTYMTDDDGMIYLYGLDFGSYTVQVVSETLPAGYSALTGADFSITKDSNESVVLYVSRASGTLNVNVKDAEGLALENISVVIKDENGNVFAEMSTNSNGNITVSNVPTGLYTIEVNVSDGYTVTGDSLVYIDEAATGTSNFVVTRDCGSLKVESNLGVANISFDIYDGELVIASGVTDEFGETYLDSLPTGEYVVKFTNVPSLYKDLEDQVIVIGKDSETLLTINLESKGASANVQYVYQATGYPTEGVQFKVTTLDGTEMGTYTTDASGFVTMTLPEGSYFVQTVFVPVGYQYPENEMFEIVDGQAVDLTIELNEANTFGIFALVINDSATSVALSDVVVALYTENGGLYKTFTTDSRGQIYDEEISVGKYYAVIQKAGYVEKTLSNIEILEDEMFFETLTLDAMVSLGDMTVTVCDDVTNAGLANANVYLRDEDGNLVASLITNSQGSVIFSDLAYGTYTLTAEANGYATSGRITATVAAQQQSATIKLTQSTTGTVSVYTGNDNAEVVPNIVVLIDSVDGTQHYELTTDADGRGSLADLEAGEYVFSVKADDHIDYAETFTILANQTNYVDLILTKIIYGSVNFTVTDENDQPLSGVTVTLSGGSSYTTDENGQVQIDKLTVNGYSATLSKDGYVDKEILFNIEGYSTTNVSTSLEKVITTGTASVVVKDELGNVLVGAVVTINGQTLTTDENGQVAFNELEAGEYEVSVSKDGYIAKTQNMTITAKTTTTANITLVKEITTGTVNVVVKDSDGNTVADAAVEVSDGTNKQVLYTDDSGCVSFEDLEKADYTITITKDGYIENVAQATVEAGKVYTINATLLKEITTGNLSVTVKDAYGNVLKDATVKVGETTLTTDENGQINMTDIEAGEYDLEVSMDGYVSKTSTATIVANATRELTISLEKVITTGDLIIQVTDSNGVALSGATVEINGVYLDTDADGKASFFDLEAGTYTVSISKDGYDGESHSATVTAKQETVLTVDLDKTITTGTLNITVKDADGNALKDADVKVGETTLTTDENGQVTFADLEAGEYEVSISKDGYVAQSASVEIEAKSTKDISVTLEEVVTTGTLVIYVEDDKGVVLSGATVKVGDTTLTSDENGKVTLNDLEAGEYEVQVSKDGYLSASGTVVIKAADVTESTMTLNVITTGNLSVTVKDADGNLLKDATVKVGDTTLTTDENGKVVLSDLEAGEYTVNVSKDGYVAQSTSIAITANATKEISIDLEKEITTGSLVVNVTDSEGAALSGATVKIGETTLTTDENGQVVFNDLEAGNYTVNVSKDGYDGESHSATITAKQETVLPVDLDKTITTGTLNVTVQDDNGNALKDATVKVGDITLTTDENGQVTFADLEAGEYEVSISKDGYVAQSASVEIAAKATREFSVNLAEVVTTGSLVVNVTDENGVALSGATVKVGDTTVTTDENGQVVLNDLEAGNYEVSISKDGYVAQSASATITAEETKELPVTLEKVITTGSLSVTVKDADGNVLSNATVKVGETTLTTDENGKVVLNDLEAGEYEVSTSKDGYVSQSTTAIIVAETTKELSVTLEKVITTGDLIVLVTDADGVALSGATVEINGTYLDTDANGKASFFDLEAGTYTVNVSKDGYDGKVYAATVTVKQETVLPVELDKTITTGDLIITVKDADGNVLKDATVKVGETTLTTDENGKVVINGLEAGNYPVSISKDGYVAQSTTATITAKATKEIDISLEKVITTGSLSVTVKDPDGNVLKDATVKVGDTTLTTDENGQVTFEDLEAGDYDISISKDGYVSQSTTATIIAEATKDFPVTLEKVITTGDLVILVTDVDGVALSGATVNIGETTLTTDENGKVVFNDLEAGNYTVNVSKDGYDGESHSATVTAKQETTLTIDLDKTITTGDLVVQVVDDKGAALSGATVKIGETTLTTDENGSVKFEGLDAGDYEVSVSKDGYVAQSASATIEVNREKTLSVALTKEPQIGSANITVLSHDGNPVSNAKVVIKDASGQVVSNVTTDANGKVLVSSLDVGSYTVTATFMTTDSEGLEQSCELTIEKNKETELTISLPAPIVPETKGDAILTVLDANGIALKNAEVKLSNGTVVTVFTIDDGTALFEDLEAGEYQVSVSLYGYTSYSGTITIEAADIVESTVTLNAITTGHLSITVKDTDGNVLDGATVKVNGQTLVSDANGKVSFSDLEAGSYEAVVSKDGYKQVTQTVSVTALTTKETDVILEEEILVGHMKVTVFDSENNVLSNATVSFNGQTYQTDENGKLVVSNILPGDYKLVTSKDGYVSQETNVTITADNTSEHKVFLNKVITTGSLSVTVKDSDGNALKDATVKVNGQTLTTDENGSVTFVDLEAGEYPVQVSKDGYVSTSGTAIIKAADVTENTFTLNAITTGNLSVTVKDADGNLLAGATVKVGETTLTTDENGKVVLNDLEAGDYEVVVSKDGYQQVTQTVPVIALNTKETTVLLEEEVLVGQLNVTVFDSENNVLSNATVSFNGQIYQTNENGEMVVSDVLAGEYKLVVSKDGYVSQETNVTITANKTADYKVFLNKVITTGSLQLTVSDAQGNKLANATVKVNGQTLTTDENGSVTFEDLEAGDYQVSVSLYGYTSYSGTETVKATEVTENTVTLNAITTGNLKVTVKDADGNALKDAVVKVGETTLTTDENGQISITDLEAGEYELAVSKDGYKQATKVVSVAALTTNEVTVLLEEEIVLGHIKVTVFDSENNVLINATVSFNGQTYQTDANGEIVIADVLPDSYKLVTSKDGYVSQETDVTITANQTTEHKVFLNKVITTGDWKVTVSDAQGNKLANATVKVNGQTLTTDENGRVTFEGLEAGDYEFEVSLYGYTSASGTVSIKAAGVTENTVTLSAITTGNLSVTVKDADGNALKDATVKVNGQTLTTDENGKVVLSNLEAGNYEIVVSKNGYQQATQTVSVTALTTKETTVVLAEEIVVGHIKVTVFDSENNVLSNATVSFNGQTYQTDENGEMVVSNLVTGDYKIVVSKDGYVSQETNVTITANVTADYKVFLNKVITTGSLSVTVKDTDGNALKDATVKVNGQTLTTDENGSVTFENLEAGDYEFEVSKDGYVSKIQTATVKAELTTTASVSLEKEITTGSLLVTVKDAEGNVLKNVGVVVNNQTLVSDENGQVLVADLEAGEYQVQVSKDGYTSQVYTAVIKAKETSLVNATLTKISTVGQYTVVITDTNNEVLKDVLVKIDGKEYTTDENGKVSMELSVGTHTIEISKNGYEAQTMTETIKPDDVINRTVQLKKTHNSIYVTVQTHDGEKLENATVYIESEDGNFSQSVKTDKNGFILFDNLPVGTYHYQVTCEGYVSVSGNFGIVENKAQSLVVAMNEKITHALVEFVVTDTEGNVLSDTTVQVGDDIETTDENGKVLVKVPLADEDHIYEYSVSKDGYVAKNATFELGDFAITRVTVALEKIPETSEIKVTVKNKDGDLLENTSVIVSDGTTSSTLTTDSFGVVHFDNLKYGEYVVKVMMTDYEGQTMTVTLDQDGQNLTFVLDKAEVPVEKGIIKAVVKDKDGNLFANTEVVIEGYKGSYYNVLTTDENGEISIELPVGVYYITANKNGYISDGATLDVESDTTVETTLILDKIEIIEVAAAEIIVKNQLGEDVVNASITVKDSQGNVVYTGTLEHTNTLHLSDLKADTYSVTVTKPNHKSATTEFTALLSQTTEVEVVLEEMVEEVTAGGLEVLVQDNGGTPLALAIVTILNADGSLYGSSTTLMNGKVVLTALPVGEYTVYASYGGYNSQRVTAIIVGDQVTTLTLVVNEPNDPGNGNQGGGGNSSNPNEGNTGNHENVQTGDSNPLKFGILATISAVGAILSRKKKKDK